LEIRKRTKIIIYDNFSSFIVYSTSEIKNKNDIVYKLYRLKLEGRKKPLLAFLPFPFFIFCKVSG